MMNQTIAVVLALLVTASMSACGSIRPESSAASSLSASASDSSAADAPSVTSSAAPTAAPSPEPAPTGDLRIDAAAELTRVLKSIQQNVTTDTADSHITAVRSAVYLLNWGVGTEMTKEEIRNTVIVWLAPKGNDESADFSNKLTAVDGAYKELLGGHAKDLLSAAGCEDAPYPWSDQPVETVETVMTTAGLR